jgi:hypothetical protein
VFTTWLHYITPQKKKNGGTRQILKIANIVEVIQYTDKIRKIIFQRLRTDIPKLCTIWGSHSGGYEQSYIPGYNAT